jgi:hypothetical protein
MTTLLIAILSFALGILSTWWARRQKDRRTLRKIARALIPDLKDVCGSILLMGGSNKWDSVEMPATPHWGEHEAALSEIIEPKAWITISGVFDEVRYFAEEAKRHEWPEELCQTDSERLEDLYQDTRRALYVLHGYAGVPKPPKPLRRMRRRERRRNFIQAAPQTRPRDPFLELRSLSPPSGRERRGTAARV